ncbi:MAG: family 43 glycosylhydrolase [Planctomycetes bacterium]|nr:family 43 glycosylhydrolase [Planctomycetota bacterium]
MKITYTNPIIDKGLADPFILKVDGVYYLFATGKAQDGRHLPIHRSTDMRNWQFVRGAVEKGADGSWNRRNFWAPEVIFLEGQYHLYYTAMPDGTPANTGNRVGLALSGSPEGPYQDAGVVIPHGSIDGSPFVDADGSLYMYYTIEHGNHDGLTAGQIYVDKMLSPRRPAGRPVQLVSHHEWQEGPCMLRRDGRYYLTYSTGAWTNDTYNVRWATGPGPMGPFAEQPEKILASTDLVKGPGHHNIFEGPDGKTWLIYHGWNPKFTARYPRLDPLKMDANGLSPSGPASGEVVMDG